MYGVDISAHQAADAVRQLAANKLLPKAKRKQFDIKCAPIKPGAYFYIYFFAVAGVKKLFQNRDTRPRIKA